MQSCVAQWYLSPVVYLPPPPPSPHTFGKKEGNSRKSASVQYETKSASVTRTCNQFTDALRCRHTDLQLIHSRNNTYNLKIPPPPNDVNQVTNEEILVPSMLNAPLPTQGEEHVLYVTAPSPVHVEKKPSTLSTVHPNRIVRKQLLSSFLSFSFF